MELGASGLESDAWLTADGQVVLAHDGVTGPVWRRRAIREQARSQLPRSIPTLAELYALCPGPYELSLDVKDIATWQPVMEVAHAAGRAQQLWLCHHDVGLMATWRAADATPRLVQSTRASRIQGGLPAHGRMLRDAGIDALNLHRREWTSEGVAAVHDSGLWALGWDAQTEAEIAGLLALGVDGVYSDHVDRLMHAIGAAQVMPPEAP